MSTPLLTSALLAYLDSHGLSHIGSLLGGEDGIARALDAHLPPELEWSWTRRAPEDGGDYALAELPLTAFTRAGVFLSRDGKWVAQHDTFARDSMVFGFDTPEAAKAAIQRKHNARWYALRTPERVEHHMEHAERGAISRAAETRDFADFPRTLVDATRIGPLSLPQRQILRAWFDREVEERGGLPENLRSVYTHLTWLWDAAGVAANSAPAPAGRLVAGLRDPLTGDVHPLHRGEHSDVDEIVLRVDEPGPRFDLLAEGYGTRSFQRVFHLEGPPGAESAVGTLQRHAGATAKYPTIKLASKRYSASIDPKTGRILLSAAPWQRAEGKKQEVAQVEADRVALYESAGGEEVLRQLWVDLWPVRVAWARTQGHEDELPGEPPPANPYWLSVLARWVAQDDQDAAGQIFGAKVWRSKATADKAHRAEAERVRAARTSAAKIVFDHDRQQGGRTYVEARLSPEASDRWVRATLVQNEPHVDSWAVVGTTYVRGREETTLVADNKGQTREDAKARTRAWLRAAEKGLSTAAATDDTDETAWVALSPAELRLPRPGRSEDDKRLYYGAVHREGSGAWRPIPYASRAPVPRESAENPSYPERESETSQAYREAYSIVGVGADDEARDEDARERAKAIIEVLAGRRELTDDILADALLVTSSGLRNRNAFAVAAALKRQTSVPDTDLARTVFARIGSTWIDEQGKAIRAAMPNANTGRYHTTITAAATVHVVRRIEQLGAELAAKVAEIPRYKDRVEDEHLARWLFGKVHAEALADDTAAMVIQLAYTARGLTPSTENIYLDDDMFRVSPRNAFARLIREGGQEDDPLRGQEVDPTPADAERAYFTSARSRKGSVVFLSGPYEAHADAIRALAADRERVNKEYPGDVAYADVAFGTVKAPRESMVVFQRPPAPAGDPKLYSIVRAGDARAENRVLLVALQAAAPATEWSVKRGAGVATIGDTSNITGYARDTAPGLAVLKRVVKYPDNAKVLVPGTLDASVDRRDARIPVEGVAAAIVEAKRLGAYVGEGEGEAPPGGSAAGEASTDSGDAEASIPAYVVVAGDDPRPAKVALGIEKHGRAAYALEYADGAVGWAYVTDTTPVEAPVRPPLPPSSAAVTWVDAGGPGGAWKLLTFRDRPDSTRTIWQSFWPSLAAAEERVRVAIEDDAAVTRAAIDMGSTTYRWYKPDERGVWWRSTDGYASRATKTSEKFLDPRKEKPGPVGAQKPDAARMSPATQERYAALRAALAAGQAPVGEDMKTLQLLDVRNAKTIYAATAADPVYVTLYTEQGFKKKGIRVSLQDFVTLMDGKTHRWAFGRLQEADYWLDWKRLEAQEQRREAHRAGAARADVAGNEERAYKAEAEAAVADDDEGVKLYTAGIAALIGGAGNPSVAKWILYALRTGKGLEYVQGYLTGDNEVSQLLFALVTGYRLPETQRERERVFHQLPAALADLDAMIALDLRLLSRQGVWDAVARIEVRETKKMEREAEKAEREEFRGHNSAVERSLVEAYARMAHAKSANAPRDAQERLYALYMRAYNRLMKVYDLTVFPTDAQAGLEKRAEAWWNSRAFKGPGVDW